MRAKADDSTRLLTIDHFVTVKSTVPAIAGQPAQIYVRERVQAGTALRGSVAGDRVVLFVHGAGTPAEVAFDVPYQDYSWMAYLAREGFDVFSMDTTGYGRSTRPAPMNDPAISPRSGKRGFVAAPCPAELSARADHHRLRLGRHQRRRRLRPLAAACGEGDLVRVVARRAARRRLRGQHPDKVQRLVLLAPAYNRSAAAAPPAKIPADGVPMNTQSHQEFAANWDRQVGCPDQYDPAAADVVWSEMLASDPVGATWGPGVRRAPQTTVWGWTTALAGKTEIPTLVVVGAHDKQVQPERARDLYTDLGAKDKVFVDLACSSHNAMWERNHLLLFQASREWLTQGTVNGTKSGVVKIGYGQSQ